MEEERKWEDMDTDCLVNIFGRLGLDDLALGLPLVCKSWSNASLDPLCWQVLDFQHLDFMPWSKLANRFASHYSLSCFSLPSLIKYALRRSSGIVVELRFPMIFCGASMEDLILVSNECPRLQSLTLPNLSLEDEVHIPELVGRWKELEFLELESKPSSFAKLATQMGSNCKLQGLKMRGAIKKEDAMAIVDHLPNIKNLNLNGSYLPKEHLLLILNGCKKIERLSVNECVGFQTGDEEIKQKAVGIEMFEDGGSKLMDDLDYETDDCDPMYVGVI